MKTFFGGKGSPPAAAPGAVSPVEGGTPGVGPPPGATLVPLLPRGTPLDVAVYLTEQADWRLAAAEGPPSWQASNVPLATGEPLGATVTYRPTPGVQRNGSAYVHAVFRARGLTELPAASPGAEDGAAPPSQTPSAAGAAWARTSPLTVHKLAPKVVEGTLLLKGGEKGKGGAGGAPARIGGYSSGWGKAEVAPGHAPDSADGDLGDAAALPASPPRPVLNYLKPNVTIALVDEFHAFAAHQIPPQYRGQIEVDESTMAYEPIVWFNEFWLLREGLVEVNTSVEEIALRIELAPIAAWKYTIFTQLEQSFSTQKSWGSMADGETDDIKRIFLEGNPIFLGITMVVSLLHSLFDMLAFKNDIGFWKQNKSMKGLSARTILINAGCQLVITLYLFDNETSFVVLFSSVVGTAIELWKVTKAMNVSVESREARAQRTRRARIGGWRDAGADASAEGSDGSAAAATATPLAPPRATLSSRLLDTLPYTLRFQDRDSYGDSDTDRYDAEAMVYLSYALYPLVIGYAGYSLWYKTHKSWYSWVLDSLVGAVYTFGFILMCPQLYLNYRLKSVAHLPWRQMSYKFLNTIIDDLFAFVIKMPWLHRLSVFRDDVVFLVYLYQRWAYRVDRTRTNEFGYAEEAPPETIQEGGATAGTDGAETIANGTAGDAAGDGAVSQGKAARRRAAEAAGGAAAPEGKPSEVEPKKDK